MLIGYIPSASLNATVFHPVLASKAAQASAAALTPASGKTASDSAAAPTASRAPSAAASGTAGAASASVQIAEEVGSYSVNVGGKAYAGSIEESDGEYTASIPNLAGATATAPSEIAAENNLDKRIDELV